MKPNFTWNAHTRSLLGLAALSGAAAVAAGAFGAHVLAARLTPRQLEIWDTATQYHLAHSLAILALALLAVLRPGWPVLVAGILFGLGIFFFSGSLYVYCLADLRSTALLAPLGGLSLMAGWLMLLPVALSRPT